MAGGVRTPSSGFHLKLFMDHGISSASLNNGGGALSKTTHEARPPAGSGETPSTISTITAPVLAESLWVVARMARASTPCDSLLQAGVERFALQRPAHPSKRTPFLGLDGLGSSFSIYLQSVAPSVICYTEKRCEPCQPR